MTIQPRRFLFTLWEGGGTIPPILGVARRLLARGHEVRVLADPTVEDDAVAAGCSFASWTRAPHRTSLDPEQDLLRDWEVGNPMVMLQRVRDRFMIGPAGDFAADTLEQIEAFGAEAVVPDWMIFGSVVAAQAAGLPAAPLVPNIWMAPTPGSPPVGPGFPPPRHPLARARNAIVVALVNRLFNTALPTLNTARARYGLPALRSCYDQVLASERIFVLTSPTFDFASTTVPDNVRYLGPMLDDPTWAEAWTPPWPPERDEPLVLVAFSSTYQDQVPLLRRVVEALSSLPLRAVVTLGQMLPPDAVTPRDNVVVVPSAPHGPILERAALIVTHCGHGTTLKALGAGVPLVCIPMGRDQNDNAARVVHQGAGIRLTTKASVERIRAAVTEVLGQSRYRANATRLASTIADERRSAALEAAFESLVDSGDHLRPPATVASAAGSAPPTPPMP